MEDSAWESKGNQYRGGQFPQLGGKIYEGAYLPARRWSSSNRNVETMRNARINFVIEWEKGP